ncbi:hypothetical protein FOL47_008531 [Perkinsus chesapeaki]|uniref:MORN repeat containing n=1 Tax=Perkinsus chesapeaki TaxID=330153 RepID=A0A7J6LDH6_PERCH|nr:hypothetical protein FOL47_008531 [Perkinsus chesapeaki]
MACQTGSGIDAFDNGVSAMVNVFGILILEAPKVNTKMTNYFIFLIIMRAAKSLATILYYVFALSVGRAGLRRFTLCSNELEDLPGPGVVFEDDYLIDGDGIFWGAIDELILAIIILLFSIYLIVLLNRLLNILQLGGAGDERTANPAILGLLDSDTPQTTLTTSFLKVLVFSSLLMSIASLYISGSHFPVFSMDYMSLDILFYFVRYAIGWWLLWLCISLTVILSGGGDVRGRRRENASIFRAIYGGELATLRADEREQRAPSPVHRASERVRMRRRDQGANSEIRRSNLPTGCIRRIAASRAKKLKPWQLVRKWHTKGGGDALVLTPGVSKNLNNSSSRKIQSPKSKLDEKAERSEIRYSDGSRYVGDVVDGRREGEGRWEYPGGYYQGGWLNNELHGQGVQTWSDGRIYVGSFLEGKFHGEGRMEWHIAGDRGGPMVYQGQYVNDKKEGYGTFEWPDGRKYAGYWVAGKRHGDGEYTTEFGQTRRGIWENDVLIRWVGGVSTPSGGAGVGMGKNLKVEA